MTAEDIAKKLSHPIATSFHNAGMYSIIGQHTLIQNISVK